MATGRAWLAQLSWAPTLTVAALLAVLLVHAASWRMMSATVEANEPARLATLVDLERSLEALLDAVREQRRARRPDHVAAARTAVVERLRKLYAEYPAAGSPLGGTAGEVECAVMLVRSWRADGAPAGAGEAVERAVVRAHAEVRTAVLAAQRDARAWALEFDRRMAWAFQLTALLVLLAAGGLGGFAIAYVRLKRQTGRRLRITEKALVQSEHLARHDPLTGLANRRRLNVELDAAIRAAGNAGPFALHLLDVDGLKAVNDRWGHAAGDALLAAVARSLTASVRAGDVVGRFGGDEFAVVQRDADPHTAGVLAQRMREAVSIPMTLRDGTRVVPRVSVGTALYGMDGNSAAALLETADQRLYGAKPRRSGEAASPPLRLVPGG